MENVTSQEAFLAAVRQRALQKRILFIQAIWDLLDAEVAKQRQNCEPRPACSKGCSLCCYQMVTCTKPEWLAIEKYLKGLAPNLLRAIMQNAQAVIMDWLNYHLLHPRAQQTEMHTDWKNKPCPFLSRAGTCSIYPFRPIDCRTACSSTRCGTEKASAMPWFPIERWANQIIAEEAGRTQGFMYTTPLHFWLEQFYREQAAQIRAEKLGRQVLLAQRKLSQSGFR